MASSCKKENSEENAKTFVLLLERLTQTAKGREEKIAANHEEEMHLLDQTANRKK